MKGNQARRLIEWTGERCVPWSDDMQMLYEHYHRYALASSVTEGKRVLDLASGEGYGCALLASTAQQVVGLELDEQTVRHAQQHYPLDNLTFHTGSITESNALAAEPPFDVITCFEAIEHVYEHDELMRLVRRKLAPGGVFVCSSPDRGEYTEKRGHANPFHVRELNENEFRDLLGHHFEHVSVLRQNVAVGSLIHGEQAEGPCHNYTLAPTDDGWNVNDGAPHTYLLGIAADVPTRVPTASALLDPRLTLVSRTAHAAASELDELRDTVSDLRTRLEDSGESVRELRTELTAALERERLVFHERDVLRAEVDSLRADYERLTEVVNQLRRQVEHDDERLTWLSGNNARLRTLRNELADDNARLRSEQSSSAYRLVERYRSTVERYVPRGTYRRRLYETALGRVPEVGQQEPTVDGPVAVTASDSPVVSVIIPVHDNWSYTRRCLESVEEHLPSIPIEVIVVDDASSDDSAARAAECPGVRLVSTGRNRGYVGACNLGAASARGELFMFLNNDTEVSQEWLDSLVDVMDHNSDVGIVGSQLVYPDGTLQESGAIVWSDASGWNYGRGDSPNEPRYRPLREVDYCSGAALLVRGWLFQRVGGFDDRYAPAYYEDTDLAFSARELGYRTMVQPGSVVMHHEGASNGTDGSVGVKRHQQANRAIFQEKWSDRLSSHFPNAGDGNLWAARQRGKHGHQGGLIVVADDHLPRPDTDSGSVRMSAILQLLVELGERVVFFAMQPPTSELYADRLQQLGITVLADPARQAEFLREAGQHVRLALLSRPMVAWRLLEQLRECAVNATVVYDTVDLHFVRLGRQAELAAARGETVTASSLHQRAAALREMELGLVRSVDVTVTVSEAERDTLLELVAHAVVRVLGNVHDIDGAPAVVRGRSGVMFVGGFDHHPNRDAAVWLAREIMPVVWRTHPGTVAHIVGSNPTDEIRNLRGEGIEVHGWVSQLPLFYEGTRVVAAPLRFGAGVKGKVGESLAHGVPVVGTAISAEGMGLESGTDILLGETAEEIGCHIVRLLESDDDWERLAVGGKRTIGRLSGRNAARDSLRTLLRSSAEESV